ncbi:MAG TPA: ABC transporter permease [Candidatus Limnocylindria bacterium]|nr:ABC transporter permease [Candidatus Limnocylindria bacterium]
MAIGVREAAEFRRPARSLWGDAWHQFRRHRLAMGGLAVLALLILATAIGPLLWPIPYNKVDYSLGLLGPSSAHPFGTDDLGHDLFARALWGGRVSIAVGIIAVAIAISLGTAVGAISGYFGGKLDNLLMRITDIFLSLPQLPLLLLTIYLFRDTLRTTVGPEMGIFLLIVIVIGVLNWMPVARLVRASFLSLKQKEFVEAARSIGDKDGRIIWVHILPNVMSPVLVAATLGVGSAIITESALSFLGLGFPPDVPTWGRMLYDAQHYIEIAPYWAIFPGLLIFAAVLSINYMGDGLRDALDPRRTS